jgi:hypothetical protein
MATIHKQKHSRPAIAAVAIALCGGVSQPAFGQEAKGLNVDVERCVALEKPEERLACFEAQVAAARQRAAAPSASEATVASPAAVVGASAPAVAGTTAPAVTGAGTSAVAGTSTPAVAGASAAAVAGASTASPATAPPATAPPVSQKSASAPPTENFGFPEPAPERPQRKPERQPVEIVATVTELRETVPNAYVITLDNGQVWRQPHPMPYPLRTGLVVQVRETRMGYRLTAPELHGQINVERVR